MLDKPNRLNELSPDGRTRDIQLPSPRKGEATPWQAPGNAPGNGPGIDSGAGAWTQVVSTNHTAGVVLGGKPLAPPWHGCLDLVVVLRQVGVGLFSVCGCWRTLVCPVCRGHHVTRAPQGCPCRPGVPGEPRAPVLPVTPRGSRVAVVAVHGGGVVWLRFP